MEREAEPGSLTHTVAAAPVLGRLVVLCLQGDELETGRNPCEAGVRAENQYQAQEGSAKHLNTPLVAQRFTTGEAGQVGQGGGIRGNGSWFSPRLAAGGVGRAVTLFGLGTSGPGECTFWPSRCCSGWRNDGSRGSGGGGEGQPFGTHPMQGALPGPQAP